MTVLALTVLSCLAALALLAVVAINLVRISRELEAIGGTPTSYLAKIRFGVRAIESQTAQLGPEVSALNARLGELDAVMEDVQRELAGTPSDSKGGDG